MNKPLLPADLVRCRLPRRKSSTLAAREKLIAYFSENYPQVKKLKIKDHGGFFVARALYGKRTLYSKAYTLERLALYFSKEYYEKVPS